MFDLLIRATKKPNSLFTTHYMVYWETNSDDGLEIIPDVGLLINRKTWKRQKQNYTYDYV
jgi:hypothetical protein